MKKLITLTFILFLFNVTVAQDFSDPLQFPPLNALVTDYSNVLDTNTLQTLNTQAFTIQQETQAQIASLLFPNRNGNELYDIGLKIARES